MSNVMRTFVQEPKCKREMILSYFGYPVSKQKTPDHTCCDFHKKKCLCAICTSVCKTSNEEAVQPVKETVQCLQNDPEDQLTDNTKKRLYDALANYRLSLHGSEPSCVGGISLATGFSIDLIDMIVNQAMELKSVEDIKTRLPIFSSEHAEVVCTIIQQVTSTPG